MRPSKPIALASVALLAGCLVLAACGTSGPPTFDAAIQEAENAAHEVIRGRESASIGIAIVHREGVVWARSFGMADVEAGIPVSGSTRFGVGSVSKMFAAVALLQLVDRGLVGLEDPVARHLPAFQVDDPRYPDVTVRMLLDHTSALPGTVFRNGFATSATLDYADEVLATRRSQRLRDAPGRMATYCNDGFTVAEALVAAVTGRSYADWVRGEILLPLGMRDSAFPLAAFPPGSYARSYALGIPQPQEYTNLLAAGGLYSTPGDMAAFARLFLNGGTVDGARILSPGSVEAMGVDRTAGTVKPVPNRGEAYGLGWDSVDEPALREAGVLGWTKNGGSFFYGAQLLVAPREGLAVVVMAPSGARYDPKAISQRVMLRALLGMKRIPSIPEPLDPVGPPVAPAPAGFAARVSGVYGSAISTLKLEPQPDGSFRLLTFSDGSFVPSETGLLHRSDGWLASAAAPARAYAVVESGSDRYLALREPDGNGTYLDQTAIGQRFEPRAGSLSPAWAARAGRDWLVVNETPDSQMFLFGKSPRLTVRAIEELPGMLVVTGALGTGPHAQIVDPSSSGSRASMTIQLPATYGRNVDDLEIVARGGEEWTRFGGYLHRPAATVLELPAGSTTSVAIGPEGFGEWRSLPPGDSPFTVRVLGSRAWRAYDPAFQALGNGTGSGEVTFPAGSGRGWLLLYGAPGGSVGVEVR